MDKTNLTIKTLDDAKEVWDKCVLESYRQYNRRDYPHVNSCEYLQLSIWGIGGVYQQDDSTAQYNHWTLRELARFSTNDYVPVFRTSSRLGNMVQAIFNIPHPQHFFPEHFLHISVEKPGMVAYTPNEKYGEADRQVRTTLAKYLNRYASNIPTSDLDALVRQYVTDTTPAQFKILTSPEEIEAAYENGPPSCMCRGRSHLSPYAVPHPVQCYGSTDTQPTDTALAVLMKRDGACVARGVVNTATKKYGRLYDNGGTQMEELRQGLVAAGYSQGDVFTYNTKIRALRSISEAQTGRLIGPYIDGHQQWALRMEEDKEYWVSVRPNPDDEIYSLGCPSGFVEEYSRYDNDDADDEETTVCDDCGFEGEHDDFVYSEYHEVYICHRCIERSYVEAIYRRHHTSTWIHINEPLYSYNGDWYHESILAWYGLVVCSNGELTHEDDAVHTEDGEIFESEECAEDEGYVFFENVWIHESKLVETFDGETHHIYECQKLNNNVWMHEDHDILHVPVSGATTVAVTNDGNTFSHTLVWRATDEVFCAVPNDHTLAPDEVFVRTLADIESLTTELEAA
jgi:hypothetical protein